MAIQWSTTLRNARLDAISTAIGASAIVRIYNGTEPATCATALSGNTLLVEWDLAASWANAASGGSKTIQSTPVSATAAATGTATFYRVYASDGTTCHEQGTVTATGGGGDMTLDNTSIVSGQTAQITAFTKTEPGA